MRQRKTKTIIALLALGIFSLVSQITLIKELTLSYYGNEFYIGLILSLWLLSTGVGSLFLAEIISEKLKKKVSWFYLSLPFVFFGCLVLAKISRQTLASSGMTPDILKAFLWSFISIFPLGVIIGALFVFLARSFFGEKKEKDVGISYVLESAGFFLGALIFSFYLFKFSSVFVAIFLGILIFLFLAYLKFKKNKILSIIAIAFAFILFLFSGKADLMEIKLNSFRYQGEKVLSSVNTRSQSIDVTLKGNRYNFYQDGKLTDSSDNTFHNELMAHVSMAGIENPGKILIIGNAFSGLANELLKYKPEKIVYLEANKEYYDEAFLAGFSLHSDVEVKHSDPYVFLKKNQEKFDLIIVNYSDPSTLAENRYFTREIFSLIKNNLSEKGIFSIKLKTKPDYFSISQKELLNILHSTLKVVFKNVETVADYQVLFLASERNINPNWNNVYSRDEELELNNEIFTPDLVKWQFINDKTAEIKKWLDVNTAEINSSIWPNLYYKKLLNSLIDSGSTNFLGWLLLGFVVLFLVIMFMVRSRGKRLFLLFSSVIPEFSLMVFEVIIVLIFQAYHGYIFNELALLVAVILLGIAIGSFVFLKLMKKNSPQRLLNISSLLIFLAFLAVTVIVWKYNSLFEYQIVYLLMSFLVSLAVGTKFPVVNHLYLRENTRLGVIYGVDLIGASIGALAAGTLILPILGLSVGFLFLTMLSFLSLIIAKLSH